MDFETKHSLLIADELGFLRDGISRVCERTEWFESIDGCCDAPSAYDHIVVKTPSLALIDFHLPRMFSLELVRKLREAKVTTRVLIMAARGDRKLALEVLRSGANGFVLKTSPASELIEAIGRVLRGSIYVSPEIEFERIFMSPRQSDGSDPVGQLSSREYQVFQLLIDGIRAKEIAVRLSLSPKTIDTYRASLMRKLDIHDLPGLVKFAIQRDLITT